MPIAYLVRMRRSVLPGMFCRRAVMVRGAGPLPGRVEHFLRDLDLETGRRRRRRRHREPLLGYFDLEPRTEGDLVAGYRDLEGGRV